MPETGRQLLGDPFFALWSPFCSPLGTGCPLVQQGIPLLANLLNRRGFSQAVCDSLGFPPFDSHFGSQIARVKWLGEPSWHELEQVGSGAKLKMLAYFQ